jgi:hypothetical protein
MLDRASFIHSGVKAAFSQKNIHKLYVHKFCCNVLRGARDIKCCFENGKKYINTKVKRLLETVRTQNQNNHSKCVKPVAKSLSL